METSYCSDWWHRDGLSLNGDRLSFAGINPARLAAELETPLFLYDANRIEANLRRLTAALKTISAPSRIFYAMKANRYPGIMTHLKNLRLCGIDVCSPPEMLYALNAGFTENDISYTGTSVSDSDIDILLKYPDVTVNCDSLSMIRRLGRKSPGRGIGLRINPGSGLGYRQNQLLQYAGSKPTKFGIYLSQLAEATALCAQYGLKINGIHFHCGCGYLTPQLPLLEKVLEKVQGFLDKFKELRYVNIGGGLGIPLVQDDAPLDLTAWARLINNHLGGREFEIRMEPGDYIVKDAGILLLEVNTVEEKEGILFLGVNGGFNLHPEPVFYNLPLHIVPCRLRSGPLLKVTIAGNINEALDIFADGISLPPVHEGDLLAFLNAGGYGSAMSSNHCCRGQFQERLLTSTTNTGSIL